MAIILGEGFFFELEGDERNVATIHGLDRYSFLGDINVDILNEIFDGINNPLEA